MQSNWIDIVSNLPWKHYGSITRSLESHLNNATENYSASYILKIGI